MLHWIALPIIGVAFGGISGNAIEAWLPLAAFGLVWGIAAAVVAPRIAQRGSRSPEWANAPVYITFVLALIVLGGGLLGGLITTTPEHAMDIFQKQSFGLFFASIHATFEWILVPLTLAANWCYPARRRLLTVVAVVFYAGRIASALYFAPRAMAWGAEPAYSPEVLDDIRVWLTLNWLRGLLQDAVTAGLLGWIALRLIPRGTTTARA